MLQSKDLKVLSIDFTSTSVPFLGLSFSLEAKFFWLNIRTLFRPDKLYDKLSLAVGTDKAVGGAHSLDQLRGLASTSEGSAEGLASGISLGRGILSSSVSSDLRTSPFALLALVVDSTVRASGISSLAELIPVCSIKLASVTFFRGKFLIAGAAGHFIIIYQKQMFLRLPR